MMTGRYQTHFGHEFNPGPMPEAADLGYRESYRPTRGGFDEFYGFLGGAHGYLDAKADSMNPILDGDKVVDKVEYTTDEFGRRGAALIEANKDRLFFLYVPFNAVHGPMESLRKYEDGITEPRRKTYAGMLSALDDNVGMILKMLERNKLTDSTLVVFLTDNGGPTQVNTSRNDPLRSVKAQIWEGGIRIPFAMQWPGKIPKGKTFSHPVIALDLLPTFVVAAGRKDRRFLEGGWC
jgi:arylsulfatase A-like enzyme